MDDPEDHALITWRNALRMRANTAIRKMLGRKSVLPEKGESVLFCRNGQGVLNGEIVEADNLRQGRRLGEIKTHSLVTRGGAEIIVSTQGREASMVLPAPRIAKNANVSVMASLGSASPRAI